MLVFAVGMGLLFVPISLVSLSKVADSDSGIASSMLNVGQQLGGSIGLAVLGTVSWSAYATSFGKQAAAAHLSPAQLASPPQAIIAHALAVGIHRGFLVAAGIALLGLVVTVVAIRVKREDLAGINPMAGG
jgi:hypothetical protein